MRAIAYPWRTVFPCPHGYPLPRLPPSPRTARGFILNFVSIPSRVLPFLPFSHCSICLPLSFATDEIRAFLLASLEFHKVPEGWGAPGEGEGRDRGRETLRVKVAATVGTECGLTSRLCVSFRSVRYRKTCVLPIFVSAILEMQVEGETREAASYVEPRASRALVT